MAKRANGEGSVYRRKDGRWAVSITLENGKQKTIYCKSRREAEKERMRLYQEKEQGVQIAAGDQTLSQFLTDWLENTAQLSVRPRTYQRYRELITLHILPTLGKVKLQKLTPQQLQKLYKTKLEEGLAPGTVKNIHRLLHRTLNDALKWRLVVYNICDAVDAPRVPQKGIRALTIEQVQTFLAAVADDPLEALYVLALMTGMRQGELLALKWEDIDFDHQRLSVTKTIARVRHQGFQVSETKTAKSRRSIPLTPQVIEALKRHRMRQYEAKRAAGPVWQEQGWVFCNSMGRPIEVASLIVRSFRPLLEKAGLPRIRFHDLRHSTASLLLMLGIHPKVVAEILGHSQIGLTLDTYSHVLPSLKEDALYRLDTFLSKQG